MSEERFDRIETRLDRLEHGQELMRAGQERLIGEVAELRLGQVDLRQHMGVLHEEVLDRIKTLTYDPEPLRREFTTANGPGRVRVAF